MKNFFFALSKLGAFGVILTMQLEPPKYKSLATSYQEQAEFGLPVKGRFDDLPEYKQVCPCEGLTAKQRHDCTQLG